MTGGSFIEGGEVGPRADNFHPPALIEGKSKRHRTKPSGSASQSVPSKLLPAGSRSATGSFRFQFIGLKTATCSPVPVSELPAESNTLSVVLATQLKRSCASQDFSFSNTIPPAEPQIVLRSMFRHMRIQQSDSGLTGYSYLPWRLAIAASVSAACSACSLRRYKVLTLGFSIQKASKS